MPPKTSVLNRFVQTSIVALVALVPVAFLPFQWATVPHAKMLTIAALTAFAALVWVIARLVDRQLRLPKSSILLAALLLPIVYAASALIGGTTASFVGSGVERDTVAAILLWFAGMAVVAVAVIRGSVLIRIYNVLLAASGIVALVQLLRIVIGPDMLTFGGTLIGPAATLVGSWHDFGILLGLSALLSAALLGTDLSTGVSRWIPRVVLPLSLFLLVIVNQQDVWVALGVLSLLSALYLALLGRRSPEQKQMWRTPIVILSILFVLSGVFAVAGTAIHSMLPDRIQVTQVEVRPSWAGTFAVATAVYQQESMLLGSGPNTFTQQWGFFKPMDVNETAFWNADFIQGVGFIPTSLVTVGIAGGVAWGIFFLLFLYRGFRSLWGAQLDTRWRLLLFALFIGSLYLWVMHVIYPPGVTLLSLAFILTGLFIAAQSIAGALGSWTWNFRESPRAGVVSISVLIPVAVLMAIASGGIARAVVADMYINNSVVVYNTTNDLEQARTQLDRALALDPENSRALRAMIELNMVEFAQIAAEGGEDEATVAALQEALSAAIQSGLSAVSVNSSDYQNWFALARVYEQLAGVAVEGAAENAQTAYERAAAENPTSPAPYLQLARLAVIQNDLDEARDNLALALNRKSNYAPALYLLSRVEATEGNSEAALLAAQGAALAAPNEPLAWFQVGALEYSAGSYEQAAAALEQAVILNVNYANALYVLGLSYVELDRVDDALRLFERVAALNPENTEVPQLITELQGTENSEN